MSDFRRTQNTFGDAFPVDDSLHGGFSFENCRRNEMVLAREGEGAPKIKAKKTGTTICGVIYKDGVVLGADTRSTGGSVVMDKNCEKIHYIAPNIYCCGAGTAADTENTTALIASQLELHRLNTDTESRVVTAMTLLKRMLFQYQGYVSAALVLGGVDVTGPHLYTVYPHGRYVLEEQAKRLVQDAILAGVWNDLGSGSNVDITIIKRVNGRVEVVKDINSIKPNEVSELRSKIKRDIVTHIPRGATRVLSSKFEPLPASIVVEDATPMEL
ncbi:hypothetical protein P43SY_003520 [Pythium insidiosum]|uniref:Proteasome subunit beta n=1 Tax=Pythium insidiosum TaxID=114742 RepID=A0AAD5LIA9_PYTIN|nr:hypothetical protein P43SY_003520 [Pythium insidiosum]